jgi:hypothetical protein
MPGYHLKGLANAFIGILPGRNTKAFHHPARRSRAGTLCLQALGRGGGGRGVTTLHTTEPSKIMVQPPSRKGLTLYHRQPHSVQPVIPGTFLRPQLLPAGAAQHIAAVDCVNPLAAGSVGFAGEGFLFDPSLLSMRAKFTAGRCVRGPNVLYYRTSSQPLALACIGAGKRSVMRRFGPLHRHM